MSRCTDAVVASEIFAIRVILPQWPFDISPSSGITPTFDGFQWMDKCFIRYHATLFPPTLTTFFDTSDFCDTFEYVRLRTPPRA